MLQLFEYHNQEIRVFGTADNPEWVASDIVSALYPNVQPKNRSTYLRNVPEEFKGLHKVQTLGGEQEVITVQEAGLYWLIFKSKSPIADPFRKWVCAEVLPSIRKTGGYGQGGTIDPQFWSIVKEALAAGIDPKDAIDWYKRFARSRSKGNTLATKEWSIDETREQAMVLWRKFQKTEAIPGTVSARTLYRHQPFKKIGVDGTKEMLRKFVEAGHGTLTLRGSRVKPAVFWKP